MKSNLDGMGIIAKDINSQFAIGYKIIFRRAKRVQEIKSKRIKENKSIGIKEKKGKRKEG